MGFLLSFCWTFCCCSTLGPGHLGCCLCMETPPLPSVLRIPPAAHSQERVSKETGNLCPHHWGHRVCLSQSQGPMWEIRLTSSQAWAAPTALCPVSCTGNRSCSQPPLSHMVSGAQARWTQPGSVTLWTLSHTHLPGNSNTVGTKGATWLPSHLC